MAEITSTVSSIFTMLGSGYEFLMAHPLLMALAVLHLVGGVVGIVLAIFRRS